ncbi:hypothetical protein B296_00056607 [Ensete ventricosum]|uniref:PA domain-containing protein n=1 Tax=Ensete ventricosum TaxID=4639 RepID=A0A426XI65_ENSVE|nr:hypothetical protein B296_00056607 [Ensete ventricosum]
MLQGHCLFPRHCLFAIVMLQGHCLGITTVLPLCHYDDAVSDQIVKCGRRSGCGIIIVAKRQYDDAVSDQIVKWSQGAPGVI